jgi:hypothetical protein
MSVSSAAASNLVAGMFGFDAREFFELATRQSRCRRPSDSWLRRA